MSVRIDSLTIRVAVTRRNASDKMRGETTSAKPSMAFAMPVAQAPEEILAPVEDIEEAEVPVSQDPRQVADRVFDLMKEEIRIGALRTGSTLKRRR